MSCGALHIPGVGVFALFGVSIMVLFTILTLYSAGKYEIPPVFKSLFKLMIMGCI